MRIVELEQGSPLWKSWRRKGLGSSDAAILWHGKHFGETIYDLWSDKVGDADKKPENYAMRRGKQLEPKAREMYASLTGFRAEPICALHAAHDFLKASLDGWDADHMVIVEIKCPNKYDHADALAGNIPIKYIPQLYHQFIVASGQCQHVHYVSYNDLSFSSVQKFALVSRPAAFFSRSICDKLIAKELAFWDCVQRRLPPRDSFKPLVEEFQEEERVLFEKV